MTMQDNSIYSASSLSAMASAMSRDTWQSSASDSVCNSISFIRFLTTEHIRRLAIQLINSLFRHR